MVVIGLSILAMTMWTARSEAHCFSIWHYRRRSDAARFDYLPHGLPKAARSRYVAPRTNSRHSNSGS